MRESNYWTRLARRRISRRGMLRASARAGVGAAGLALVGCGGDDDDDQPAPQAAAEVQQDQQQQALQQAQQQAAQVEQQDEAQQQAVQAQQQAEQPQAQQQAQAQAQAQAQQQAMAATGGVYRRSNTSTPNFASLGFGTAGNNNGFNEDYSIFERLARVSPSTVEPDSSTFPNLHRAVDQDFTIEPVLANGWETPDNLTWIFDVRTDPVWHTGRAFDIEDIHYMFESIRDPNVAGGGAPVSRMTANLGLGEATDATTYRLALTRPTGYIETLIEQANIVDRETYDRREDEALVIGTGPYTFTNYDPNRGWDQLPHPQFASSNNHPVYSGGGPQFEKIQHTIFADTGAMGLAFEAGELDSHQGVPIGLPEIEERLLEDDRFNAYTGWGVGGRVLRFRADAEPFRNKLARQAVLMLVDAERIRRDFGGTFDIAGRLPWQPGSVAFVPELDPHPMSVDPDAARTKAGQLLDAAGFTGGEVLKIDTLAERLDAPALAQIIQQEVGQFGIETEISPREYTEIVTLLTTGTFEHLVLGTGAWIRPGSPAYTVLYSDEYTGRFSAPHDDNVPLEQRPGISDEPEWLDMIQQAIDGTWTDWEAWNEKLLDVAWGHALFRQYRVNFESKDVVQQYTPDANSWPYAPGTHFAG